MDSMAIIGDKTKHKNIPNEDGSNLCVCCKRYNLHYSKKYNINASNRDAYVAAFNFEVPIGVCCNSCYNKQYRFNKNNQQHDETLSSTENNNNTENSKNKRKRNNSSRKSSIASSSGSSSRSREEEDAADETLRIADGEINDETCLVKRSSSSNCSSSSSENNDDEISPSSSKKRKRSLTSLVTTTNTTTIVDQNANPTESQNSQNDLLTPWNALSNQDDEFLHLLDSIPNNNYVKHQVVETLLPQIPHQPPTHYNQHVNNNQLHHQQHSLQSLLNEMATNNANTSNLINNSTSNLPFSNMMLYNQHQYHHSSSPSKSSSMDQSFVEMVLGQDTASTNQMLNSLDINELAMKRMKGNQTNHQLGMSNAQLSTSNSSITTNEMAQPFCILDSNTTASTTSSSTTPTVMTNNLSNPQMFNMSPSSAPFLSQFFSTIPSSQPHQQPQPPQQQYSFAVTPQVSPNGTAQAAMFVIFFDDSRILTFADYSHYENSLMTSKFSIHKCCTFSYLCEQLSEKMVNEKKLWNINMLKSITQIKLKRSGVLTPLDPYTTPQLQFEHGDVLLVHLV